MGARGDGGGDTRRLLNGMREGRWERLLPLPPMTSLTFNDEVEAGEVNQVFLPRPGGDLLVWASIGASRWTFSRDGDATDRDDEEDDPVKSVRTVRM